MGCSVNLLMRKEDLPVLEGIMTDRGWFVNLPWQEGTTIEERLKLMFEEVEVGQFADLYINEEKYGMESELNALCKEGAVFIAHRGVDDSDGRQSLVHDGSGVIRIMLTDDMGEILVPIAWDTMKPLEVQMENAKVFIEAHNKVWDILNNQQDLGAVIFEVVGTHRSTDPGDALVSFISTQAGIQSNRVIIGMGDTPTGRVIEMTVNSTFPQLSCSSVARPKEDKYFLTGDDLRAALDNLIRQIKAIVRLERFAVWYEDIFERNPDLAECLQGPVSQLQYLRAELNRRIKKMSNMLDNLDDLIKTSRVDTES